MTVLTGGDERIPIPGTIKTKTTASIPAGYYNAVYRVKLDPLTDSWTQTEWTPIMSGHRQHVEAVQGAVHLDGGYCVISALTTSACDELFARYFEDSDSQLSINPSGMPIGPFGYQIGNGSWHGMVRWTSGTGKNNDLYIFWKRQQARPRLPMSLAYIHRRSRSISITSSSRRTGLES